MFSLVDTANKSTIYCPHMDFIQAIVGLVRGLGICSSVGFLAIIFLAIVRRIVSTGFYRICLESCLLGKFYPNLF